MDIKKYYEEVFSFICLLSTAYGQSIYKKGYVVLKESNRKIDGYIKDKGNFRNINVVNFKEGLSVQEKEYSVEQIKSFSLSGNVFIVMPVKLDDKYENKILQVLEDGKIMLLYQKDKFGKEHLYVYKDYMLVELLPEMERGYGSVVIRDLKDTYKYTLYNFTKDSKEFRKKKVDLPYKVSNISEFIKKYNKLSEPNEVVSYKKNNDVFKVEKYLMIGGNYSDVSIKGVASSYMESSAKYSPSFGVRANVFMPNLSNIFSMEFGLLYNLKGAEFKKNKISFNSKYIDMETMFKYNSRKGKIRPSFGLGLMFGYLLNSDDAFTRINSEGEKVSLANYEESLGVGFITQLALNFHFKNVNKLVLIFDYQKSECLSNEGSEYYNNLIGIKLGYKF